MTLTSVDTQDLSNPNFYEKRLGAENTEVPEVERLGNRDEIDDASEDVLRVKFEQYAEAAPKVVLKFNEARARFDEAYADYIQIFTSMETLDSINQTAQAIAPEYNLLEEFEIISKLGTSPELGAVIGKVTLYGGGLTALGGLFKAGYEWRKASTVLSITKGKPIGARNSASIVSKAKVARRWKVLGTVGAVVTVGTAAVGILTAIENNARRIAFLRDSVESYQDWYAGAVQDISEFENGASKMEAAINEMMTALNFSTPEELIAFLQETVQVAGQVQAGLQTATRMLCDQPPLSASKVAMLTGLPFEMIERREGLIRRNPSLCTLGG